MCGLVKPPSTAQHSDPLTSNPRSDPSVGSSLACRSALNPTRSTTPPELFRIYLVFAFDHHTRRLHSSFNFSDAFNSPRSIDREQVSHFHSDHLRPHHTVLIRNYCLIKCLSSSLAYLGPPSRCVQSFFRDERALPSFPPSFPVRVQSAMPRFSSRFFDSCLSNPSR